MVAWKKGLFARILAAYGARCARCGETDPAVLVVDHVNDDGAAHRGRGKRKLVFFEVYADVIRRGFPPDFQILCANCNVRKERARHDQ